MHPVMTNRTKSYAVGTLFLCVVVAVQAAFNFINVKTQAYSFFSYEFQEYDEEGVLINSVTGTLGANTPQTYNLFYESEPGAVNHRFKMLAKYLPVVRQGASWIASPESEETMVLIDQIMDGTQTHNVLGPNGALQPEAEKPIWELSATTFDGDVYREGVDKVAGRLDKVVTALGASGESGGMTLTEFETTKTEGIASQQQSIIDDPHAAVGDGGPLMAEATLAGEAAKTALTDAIIAATETHVVNMGTPDPSASDDFDITMNFAGRSVTINLNPANYPRIAEFSTFIKRCIAWAIFVMFEWFLWTEFRALMLVASGSQPAKGNPVVGGTGAQVTSLLVATLITAIIVTLPTLYWAAMDSDIVWATDHRVNPIDTGGGTNIGRAVFLLKFCFPYATALAAITSSFYVRKFGLITVLGVRTLIRFFIA